jgi:hypothetical protein
MGSRIETYLNRLDELTGRAAEYNLMTAPGEAPPLWVIWYREYPDSGMITAFTYGLSSVDHPEWTLGRPELVVAVRGSSTDWGTAAGYIAREMRGELPFSYGSILDFGERISDDSDMSAFFIFAPIALSPQECALELPDGRVNLVQLYPVYSEELVLLQERGVQAFFFQKDIDLYDTRRPAVDSLPRREDL